MKKLLLLAFGAAIALAPPVLAQTIPGGGGSGGTPAPCSAFGTTAGTCVQGAGALGTPSSGTATNITGLPVSTGVSGLGTGVATALGTNVGSAGAPVVNGGALGTPSSGTGTNLTGVPISTGISGLGTGVGTALGVNVGSAGAPVVNGGALGTPSSGTGTNLTGVPIATGISGLGSGVATALAIAHDATGGVCTVGGSGCPGGGSGSVTSITAGAGINLSTNPCTTTCTASTTWAINAQTGTTYTVVSGDASKLVTFSNGSAVAVTLPQATGSFAAGFAFDVQNKGVGTVTITPTTSTINGSATLTLATNTGCSIVSDGTNYQISACTALGGGAGTVTTTGSPASGNLAKFSGATSIVNADLTGDVTTSGGVATTLATSGVSAATYGDSTHVAQIAVDAKGRITSASNVAVSGGGGSGALTLISTLTASSSASLAWTGLTITNLNDYRVVCRTILPATTGVKIWVQLGEGGTPTWETSGYNWGGAAYSTGGSVTGEGATNDSGFDLTISLTMSNGGTIGASAKVDLIGLAAGQRHIMTHDSLFAYSSDNTLFIPGKATGDYTTDTNAITAIRVIASSGNLASGTCSLYSIAN
jgi:hypothetical protein